MLKPLAVALALASIPAAAMADAESQDPGDILGVWSFQTQTYRDGACIMTGTMQLTPSPEAGVYQCELTALEMCSLWGQSLVRQTCTAKRFGDQVSVRSQIAEMLDATGEFQGMQLNYVPDNFALTVKSPMRMYGSLVSAVTAPVEFTRSMEGIS